VLGFRIEVVLVEGGFVAADLEEVVELVVAIEAVVVEVEADEAEDDADVEFDAVGPPDDGAIAR